ncbi:MAG: Flp pilus assembly protein TadB, partial [uncultured Blastococcus sp.]
VPVAPRRRAGRRRRRAAGAGAGGHAGRPVARALDPARPLRRADGVGDGRCGSGGQRRPGEGPGQARPAGRRSHSPGTRRHDDEAARLRPDGRADHARPRCARLPAGWLPGGRAGPGDSAVRREAAVEVPRLASAGGLRRPARRLPAADGREPARGPQPAARGRLGGLGSRRTHRGGVRADRQRDPRGPRPQRRPRRGRRADGQRRLHLGRAGHRHPPRGGRQPGRGARRRGSHHPRAQPDPPAGEGAVGGGQAVGDRADGPAVRRHGVPLDIQSGVHRQVHPERRRLRNGGRGPGHADRGRPVAQEDRGDHLL